MASVVFSSAQLKVFLTASAEIRAERRFKQLLARGETADLAAITADLLARDERDRARAVAPLEQAADALLLETSNLTADEAIAQVLAWWRALR
jgi:3-phosphoshikimate 1-carboxyvinyltransferase/cytidylate kinase